jgi:hypothetical protein
VSIKTKIICFKWLRKWTNRFQKIDTTVAKMFFSVETEYFSRPSHKLDLIISMNSFLFKKVAPGFFSTARINSRPIILVLMAY